MATKAQHVDFLLSPVREPGSGLIVTDGRVFFYSPGTTTPVTVYANRNKTVTAPNPFHLGNDGTGVVFVDGVVDIVMKHSNGYGDDRQDMWTQFQSYSGMSYKATFDPLEFNLDDYADLNAAITAIGATEADLIVNKTAAMTGNVAVPTTCVLKPTRKGYIDQGVHTLTINSPFDRGRVRVFLGSGPVTFAAGTTEAVYPEWFSATGGVKQAWEASAASSKVSLARRGYTETTGISNTTRGGTIEGVVGERNNTSIRGSVITYTGNGEWFKNGTDDGLDWDLDSYDGPQTIQFSNFSVKCGSAATPLSNGAGNYGSGSYGIRDFRGGTIRMRGMHFENWDYPFWGVQSDINELDATIMYCEHGFFLGPRSDQTTIDRLYALYCTQALIIDGPSVWVRNLIIKECGHEAKCPVEIRQMSQANRICRFGDAWVEDYGGGTTSYVNAFFDVGISAGNQGAATTPCEVVIDNLTYLNHPTPPKTKTIAQVGKGYVKIYNPKGDYNNIDALIDFTGGYGNTLARGHVDGPSFLEDKCFTNSGGGTPKMTALLEGPEGFIFISSSNKQFFRKFTTAGDIDANKSYAIMMAVDNQLVIDQPDLETDNTTILHLNRRHYRGLVSSPGDIRVGPLGPFTLIRGDSYTVALPSNGQPFEYVCTISGTYGDYAALENRTATTTTGGSATTVTLSAATTKLKKGQYIAIAGAGVAAATLNTSIVSVAANGLSIVIADAASTANSGLAISFRAPTTRTISVS